MSDWFKQTVKNNDWEGLDIALQNGEDVNAEMFCSKQTAIDYACSNGNTKSVEVLLKHGADPRPADEKGPIYTAVWLGHTNIVKLLLARVESGCADFNVESFARTAINKPNKISQNKMQGFSFGIEPEKIDVGTQCLKLLLDKVNADHIDCNVGSMLHTSVSTGYLECLKLLIDVGKAEVNSKDTDGNTVLHIAASKNRIEIARYLLSYTDINFDTVNNQGKTAKQLCTSIEMAKLLNMMNNVFKNEVTKKGKSEDSKLNTIENDIETSRNKLLKVKKEMEKMDVQIIELSRRKEQKLTVEIPAIENELTENLAKKESYLQGPPAKKIKQEENTDGDAYWNECPICSEVMASPKTVYQCAEGHCFCSDCPPSLTLCPICQMDVTNYQSRNRAMEKMIENGGKM